MNGPRVAKKGIAVRHRTPRRLVTAVAVALTLSVATTHPAAAEGQPRVFGLSAPGADYGLSSATGTARELGRQLDVNSSFESWNFGNVFPADAMRVIARTGAVPEITWEPWDPTAGAKQPTYTLERIAAGVFDRYVDSWATAIAAYGGPLYLRFAHEMTGNWYPWAPATTGTPPEVYVAAWRHVHDRFTAAGAHNVSWVWSPGVVEGQPTLLRDVYPGPDYVDVVAFDGYNTGSDEPEWGGWKGPEELFANTIKFCTMLAPDKPLWINEIGSTEHGGDKAAWITDLFAYLRTTRVTGVIWYDSPVETRDYRLNSSPATFYAATTSLRDW